MSVVIQEMEATAIAAAPTGPAHDFSQQYSRGELEEMSSRELLEGYAE
jgi:hypothetical protein